MRRPLAALGLLVLWIVVPALSGRAGPPPTSIVGAATDGLLRPVAIACLLLVIAARLLRWRGLGFAPPRPGTLRLLGLPVLYLLFTASLVAATGLPAPAFMAVLLVNMLLVSFSEELMFRGFLYSGLRDRLSLWSAALLSSVLFGAVHILNVALTGHLRLALLQSVAATLLGLLLLGLRLRMGSLWPPILLHAAWNFGLILLARDAVPPDPSEPLPLAAQIGPILFVLPLGLHGIRLLRQEARAETGRPPIPPPPRLSPWGTPP